MASLTKKLTKFFVKPFRCGSCVCGCGKQSGAGNGSDDEFGDSAPRSKVDLGKTSSRNSKKRKG